MTLPYIHSFRDRHGQLRRYFRRAGFKQVALSGKPGSVEFQTAYSLALAGCEIERRPIGAKRSAPGTVGAAIAAYYADNSFLALAPGTRKMRRAILERFRANDGDRPIARMEQKHIAKLLGSKKPFAARNWLKTLRGLMQFAAATHLRAGDPTEGIKPGKARAGTIHTWTEDEIAIFESHYAVGTRERLALALLLYTAARRGDAVGLGRQHVRAGRLRYRQQKTGRALEIPIHPALVENIAALPPELTFLVTAHGRPFTAAGFGNWFRDACDRCGLEHCSAHGLRKAQARRLAEAGCSAHEIAAITGHKTLSEVQRYTADAEQARMATAAFARANQEPRLATRNLTSGKP